jgi:8-oxo-dGTP pyrophosphatase MutT (NUDIX family)
MSVAVARTSSAVAIIETPNSFVLEGCPAAADGIELAHENKWQFFGGSIDLGEDAPAAIVRELGEELDLHLAQPPELVWAGWFDRSQNRRGETVRRFVSLFHLWIDSADSLDLQVPGSIVEIPKDEASVEGHKENLTEFAYEALKRLVIGRRS